MSCRRSRPESARSSSMPGSSTGSARTGSTCDWRAGSSVGEYPRSGSMSRGSVTARAPIPACRSRSKPWPIFDRPWIRWATPPASIAFPCSDSARAAGTASWRRRPIPGWPGRFSTMRTPCRRRRSRVNYYLHRFQQSGFPGAGRWIARRSRSVLGRLLHGGGADDFARAAVDAGASRIRSKAEFVSSIMGLHDRGVRLHVIYSAEGGNYNYPEQFWDFFKGTRIARIVTSDYLSTMDHTATDLTLQEDFMRRVEEWTVELSGRFERASRRLACAPRCSRCLPSDCCSPSWPVFPPHGRSPSRGSRRHGASRWRRGATASKSITACAFRCPTGRPLSASVYRPGGPVRPLPTVLVRLPYHRLRYERAFTAALFFARHGYAVLVQDLRGTGDSGGELLPWRDAAADGVATLDWIARAAVVGREGRNVRLLGAGRNPVRARGAAPPAPPRDDPERRRRCGRIGRRTPRLLRRVRGRCLPARERIRLVRRQRLEGSRRTARRVPSTPLRICARCRSQAWCTPSAPRPNGYEAIPRYAARRPEVVATGVTSATPTAASSRRS